MHSSFISITISPTSLRFMENHSRTCPFIIEAKSEIEFVVLFFTIDMRQKEPSIHRACSVSMWRVTRIPASIAILNSDIVSRIDSQSGCTSSETNPSLLGLLRRQPKHDYRSDFTTRAGHMLFCKLMRSSLLGVHVSITFCGDVARPKRKPHKICMGCIRHILYCKITRRAGVLHQCTAHHQLRKVDWI